MLFRSGLKEALNEDDLSVMQDFFNLELVISQGDYDVIPVDETFTETKTKSIKHFSTKELIQLRSIADSLDAPSELSVLYKQLLMVNSDLWEIEDKKRKHEKEQNFNDEFVQLARQVYIKNDLRASIKKKINVLVGSDIVEEKSY